MLNTESPVYTFSQKICAWKRTPVNCRKFRIFFWISYQCIGSACGRML